MREITNETVIKNNKWEISLLFSRNKIAIVKDANIFLCLQLISVGLWEHKSVLRSNFAILVLGYREDHVL